MIIGIGTDLLDRRRLLPDYLQENDPFLRRCYTKAEQQQAQERADPTAYYATRFAGKEAVFKCFAMSSERISLLEIEILDDANGAPHCTLSGTLAALAGGARVHISLSWDGDMALAFAVLARD